MNVLARSITSTILLQIPDTRQGPIPVCCEGARRLRSGMVVTHVIGETGKFSSTESTTASRWPRPRWPWGVPGQSARGLTSRACPDLPSQAGGRRTAPSGRRGREHLLAGEAARGVRGCCFCSDAARLGVFKWPAVPRGRRRPARLSPRPRFFRQDEFLVWVAGRVAFKKVLSPLLGRCTSPLG